MHQKIEMFENRLNKVFKHRSKLAKRQQISCYRVYENDLPEFPISIDMYDDKVYVCEYLRRHGLTEEEHENWYNLTHASIKKILQVTDENIFYKQRKRMHHRQQQYEKQEDSSKDFFTVKENNLNFIINLSTYLDTGLFLDHRITRAMVQPLCKGKRVLNLFCYTGSFSVYAAAGEARFVTSVDLSKTYLDWAQQNFVANNITLGKRYDFVHADVLQYLKTVPANSYDIIVMDPPTFSNSKRMKDFLDIQADHVQLINDCMRILDNDGQLFFSTNFTKFVLNEAAIKASQIKNITKQTIPFDFEGKLKRWCYLLNK